MYVRELTRDDFQEFALIYRGAYPGTGITLDQAMESLETRFQSPDMKILLAVDESGKILGGLTMLDFTIYHGTSELKMSGIGTVAVGLDAKKRGVAKFLLEETLQRMLDADIPVSILYPFRHDFYQQMGWGQVGEVKEYKFAPSSLTAYPERKWVRRYRSDDLPAIKSCYDQFALGGNCAIKRTDLHWERKFKPVPELYVFEKNGTIEGYVQVAFPKGNASMLHYDMVVGEMVYLTEEAYFGLLGFLSSQFDQVASIFYFTHRNDPFHLLLKEPRREQELFNRLYHYAQRMGVGWMYRLVNVEKALEGRADYNGVDLDVTFIIEDSFLPRNSGSYRLVLEGGKPTVTRDQVGQYQVKTDISTFAQLFTNYVTFSQAVQIRKALVNDTAILKALEAAFAQPEALMLEFF